MAVIPKDVTVEILLNLSVKEILQKCRVSRQYDVVCQDDRFWKRYAQERMGLKEKPEMVKTWKDFVLIRTRMSPYVPVTTDSIDKEWDQSLLLPSIFDEAYIELLLGKMEKEKALIFRERDVYFALYRQIGNELRVVCYADSEEEALKRLTIFYLLICRLAMYVMDIAYKDVIHKDLNNDIILTICENNECDFLCPKRRLRKLIKELGMKFTYPSAIMQLQAYRNFERWYNIANFRSGDIEDWNMGYRKLQVNITITKDILRRLIGLQERDSTERLSGNEYSVDLYEKGSSGTFIHSHRIIYDKKEGKLRVTSWYPKNDAIKQDAVIQGFWNRFSKRLFLYET